MYCHCKKINPSNHSRYMSNGHVTSPSGMNNDISLRGSEEFGAPPERPNNAAALPKRKFSELLSDDDTLSNFSHENQQYPDLMCEEEYLDSSEIFNDHDSFLDELEYLFQEEYPISQVEAEAQETEMEATFQDLNVATPSNINDRPSIGKTTFVIGQEEAEAQETEMEATVQDSNVATGSNINNHGQSIGETDDNVIGQLEDEAEAQAQVQEDMQAPVQGANATRVTYAFYDAYTSPGNINPAPAQDEMPQYATTTRIYVRYPTIENVPTNAILCGPENKDRYREGSPNFHRGNLVYRQAIGAFWPARDACQGVKEQTTLNTRILGDFQGHFLMPCKENGTKRLPPPPHAPRGQDGWYYLMTSKWARNKVNQSFIDGTAERAFMSQQNNGN